MFLTGRTGTEDIVSGLRAGAHDYLKKPFEPAELTAHVGAAVRTKDLQDRLRTQGAEFDRISRTDALTGVFNGATFTNICGNSAAARSDTAAGSPW